jgi:DNA polymerase III subunit beta
MRFTINSKELLAKLQLVNHAISSNPILPILEDFLFDIKGETLTISASDTETTITNSIQIKSDSDFLVSVPSKFVLSILSSLPSQPVTFLITEKIEDKVKTFSIQITSANGKYSCMGEDGNDFPIIQEFNEENQIIIPSEMLSHGINKTLFATSSDELRPMLTGCYFDIKKDSFTIVGASSRMMSKIKFDLKSENEHSFIVPKKPLNFLKSSLPKIGNVKMSYSKSNAFFCFDDVTMYCRLIDARYPDYEMYIPKNNDKTLKVDLADLKSSIKRVSLCGGKDTGTVFFKISDNNISVISQDLMFSSEGVENLACSFDSEAFEMCHTASGFLEVLSNFNTKEVSIELFSNATPAVIRDNEGFGELTTLIMPMMDIPSKSK